MFNNLCSGVPSVIIPSVPCNLMDGFLHAPENLQFLNTHNVLQKAICLNKHQSQHKSQSLTQFLFCKRRRHKISEGACELLESTVS